MLKSREGLITTDTNEIVNILNEQFSLVFNAPADDIVTNLQSRHFKIIKPCEVNRELFFSVTNIIKELKSIDIRKSVGPDGVHPLVLKECMEVFG